MEFCPNCRNMLYIITDKNSLIKECKNCKYNITVTTTEPIKLSETSYSNDNLLYEYHKSNYIRQDPTLQRVKDQDINNGKSTIYIKYNPIDMKYMYVCEETGKISRNKDMLD